ncbi:DNA-3-methyladenine glycosylase 2 family protein [Phytohabitans rumicis]|uniref:DNA-3-methyladenine glycosylase 2 family protein n=1 Tax=Phytohabitans rumicis TaxID=1076125 RepID=A0A6V8LA28_9ACTN|nr:DNA-3-methyladenine glycosylase 2 family protein [Phytohabitans rumicis]
MRKAFRLGAEAVVAELGPDLSLGVHSGRALAREERAEIERAVSRWLSLDDDMSGFLASAERDGPMAHVVRAAHGLHQVRFASLAEGTVYFTLTQRSTQWYATARKRRIAAELGPRLTVDGVDHVAFPSLATIGALGDAELIGYAGNRQRADRLRTVVAGVAALDEEWLHTGAYDEVRKALLAVPGIGEFTAQALLLRVLGRPDDAPLGMAQFEAAARAVYGETPPGPAELRAHYGRWVGWWAYYARTASSWVAEPLPVAA